MTETEILQWLIPLFGVSVLGNVLGVFVGVAYAVKYHGMVSVATDFRYYMQELVPQKYHVQSHRPAKPKPGTAESENDQQTWLP